MIESLRESPMRQLFWLGVSTFLATAALAQSTQHNESDLDFVNRLSSKTEHLAGRVDNLFAITGYERGGRSAANSGGTGFGVDRSNDSYGSPQTGSRSSALVTESELNRVNRKLVSISRKLPSLRVKDKQWVKDKLKLEGVKQPKLVEFTVETTKKQDRWGSRITGWK